MPIDKRKLNALLEEIAQLDRELETYQKRKSIPRISKDKHSLEPHKRPLLAETEKQIYYTFNHYFKLVMMSFQNAEVGLQIWIRGTLPFLLKRNNIEVEEWERICDIGDNSSDIQKEIERSWKHFFKSIVKTGKIEEEVLSMISEGRKKDEWRSQTSNK